VASKQAKHSKQFKSFKSFKPFKYHRAGCIVCARRRRKSSRRCPCPRAKTRGYAASSASKVPPLPPPAPRAPQAIVPTRLYDAFGVFGTTLPEHIGVFIETVNCLHRGRGRVLPAAAGAHHPVQLLGLPVRSFPRPPPAPSFVRAPPCTRHMIHPFGRLLRLRQGPRAGTPTSSCSAASTRSSSCPPPPPRPARPVLRLTRGRPAYHGRTTAARPADGRGAGLLVLSSLFSEYGALCGVLRASAPAASARCSSSRASRASRCSWSTSPSWYASSLPPPPRAPCARPPLHSARMRGAAGPSLRNAPCRGTWVRVTVVRV
jgi:hypothetical protein